MKKFAICTVVLFAAVFCRAQHIDPQPEAADYRGFMACRADFTKEQWQVDFRSCDLSNEDLSKLDQNKTMRHIDFDDKTVWPKGNKMPKWLNPQKIMKIGKTPGLKVKQLHKKGITGKGIGIAIIDQNLPKHAEYQDRLVFNKNYSGHNEAEMHGPAVASIALGKTVGVAPGAYLYYIAARFSEGKAGVFNAAPITEAIEEILSLNETLPADKKIAVISISRGFGDRDEGRAGFLKILEKAKKQNVAVFTTNDVFALSRDGYPADPDNLANYNTWASWAPLEEFAAAYARRICMPMDFRITASPTGYNDYAAYGAGGLSWAVPYYAGVYALAKQVYPALDRETFEAAARATAQSRTAKDNETGASVAVKYFINPVGLIEYFRKK